jgi:predicted  nucleic acid-binding Zn-ribbon protein
MNIDQLKDDIDEMTRTIEDTARILHDEIFEEPGAQKFREEITRHKRALKAYDSLLTGVHPMMKDISDRLNANAPRYEFSTKTIREGLKHLEEGRKKIKVRIENNDQGQEAYLIERYMALIDEITTRGTATLEILQAAVRGGRRTRRNRRNK